MELPFGSAILLLDMYLMEIKSLSQRYIYSIMHSSQDMETTKWWQMSIERICGLYIYNGKLFSHKKKEALPFVTT